MAAPQAPEIGRLESLLIDMGATKYPECARRAASEALVKLKREFVMFGSSDDLDKNIDSVLSDAFTIYRQLSAQRESREQAGHGVRVS